MTPEQIATRLALDAPRSVAHCTLTADHLAMDAKSTTLHAVEWAEKSSMREALANVRLDALTCAYRDNPDGSRTFQSSLVVMSEAELHALLVRAIGEGIQL